MLLGMGQETFSTVLVAFALSTICVGFFFYILGYYELGNAVYFFPRHVIMGCIGGIGIFLFTTALEGSTNQSFSWNILTIKTFFSNDILPLWLLSLFFEIILRILQTKIKNPLLAPFYFFSIPFIVYIFVFLFSFQLENVHKYGYFFEGVSGNTNYLLIWELIDFKTVNWTSIGQAFPTILALTVFSLMHVPVSTNLIPYKKILCWFCFVSCIPLKTFRLCFALLY